MNEYIQYFNNTNLGFTSFFVRLDPVTKAFVFITTEMGHEREALTEINAFPEVEEAHITHGLYDIIVVVEAESPQDVKDAISFKIRRLDKVRSTLTMISHTEDGKAADSG